MRSIKKLSVVRELAIFAFLLFGVCANFGPAAETEQRSHYYRRAHALCIGIDTYKTIPGVNYAEADAKSFAEALRTQFGFETELILGKDAEKTRIMDSVKELAIPSDPNKQKFGERDVVVIFFAGHGQVIDLPILSDDPLGRRGFLIPHGANLVSLDDFSDPKTWENEAIDMREFCKVVNEIPAQHVVIIVDACCSGFMTSRGSLPKQDAYYLRSLVKDRSMAVLSATTERQDASWNDKLGHGHFTIALLNELQRCHETREAASMTEIFSVVRKSVSNETESQMNPQMNSHFREDGGEFVWFPTSIFQRDIDEMERTFEKGEAAKNQHHVLSKVIERAQARANARVKIQDLLEISQTPSYEFASDAPKQEQQWKIRFARLSDSASNGDPLAMASLHYCHDRGLGTVKNAAEAKHWAQQAYETGSPAGKHVLGRCYRTGIGEKSDPNVALELFNSAAAEGFSLSQLMLGLKCEQDGQTQNDPENIRRARDWYTKAAAGGVAEAYLQLANLHSGTRAGIPLNLDAARDYLRKAVELGNVQAKYMLYDVLSIESPHRDLAEAEKLLRSAAAAGAKNAQFMLGLETYPIQGPSSKRLALPDDVLAAEQWFKLSAAQGTLPAHMMLADLYEKGSPPIRADFEKAKSHCEIAAKGNWPSAYGVLSRWYFLGTVVERNVETSLRYAERGAALKDPVSLLLLGSAYLDDTIPIERYKQSDVVDGVTIRDHYALHYMTLGAAEGNPEAMRNLKEYFVPKVRANPSEPFVRLFLRDYPETAKTFTRLTNIALD